jgi:hypothetical protein
LLFGAAHRSEIKSAMSGSRLAGGTQAPTEGPAASAIADMDMALPKRSGVLDVLAGLPPRLPDLRLGLDGLRLRLVDDAPPGQSVWSDFAYGVHEGLQ